MDRFDGLEECSLPLPQAQVRLGHSHVSKCVLVPSNPKTS